MKKPKKEEVQWVMDKLLKRLSLEEIAVALGKSYGVIYRWHRGVRVPDGANFEVLKRLAGR